MIDADQKPFAAMLTPVLDLFNMKATPGAISLWWGALAPYSLESVRGALSAYVRDTAKGMYPPKPADIIGKIQSRDGRPGAEEAWAHVSHALGNEAITLVLTAEMQRAFFVADALSDDRVAARMAFKETYTKAVSDARTLGLAIEWIPMLGHDPAGRESAVTGAVALGRLGVAHAASLLPYRDQPAPEVRELLEHKEVA